MEGRGWWCTEGRGRAGGALRGGASCALRGGEGRSVCELWEVEGLDVSCFNLMWPVLLGNLVLCLPLRFSYHVPGWKGF